MRRSGQFTALVLIVMAIVGLLAWVFFFRVQMRYQGRTMSSWLNDQRFIDYQLASKVWTSFGSNAVPFLTTELSTGDGVTKKLYWKAAPARRFLPQAVNRILPDLKPAWFLKGQATMALTILGKQAAPVIPALIDLAKYGEDTGFTKGYVRGRAVAALGNIGQSLSQTDPLYKRMTEALLEASNDSDDEVRGLARNCITNQFPEVGPKAGFQ